MRLKLLALGLLLPVLLAACGSDDGGSTTPDAAASDGGGSADSALTVDARTPDSAMTVDASSASFTLTSTAYSEGGVIPNAHSCRGVNTSPALSWTAGPSGTLSYAIVFTDITPGAVLIHSAIWDIPASVTSLPEGVMKVAMPPVPAGAKQCRSYDPSVIGYNGPCPGSMHTYQFKLYAINAATLPGVTTTSTRAQVQTAVNANMLGTATLTGTFTP